MHERISTDVYVNCQCNYHFGCKINSGQLAIYQLVAKTCLTLISSCVSKQKFSRFDTTCKHYRCNMTKVTKSSMTRKPTGPQLSQPGGCWWFNSSPHGQNGRHFADDMFKRIFLNENIWILNKISLKYVHCGLIDNMSALVQIMTWCRTGDKPLSEPMLIQFNDAYMRHWG